MAEQGRSVSTLGLFGIWLGFAILVVGLGQAVTQILGWDTVDYADLANSTENMVRHLIVPDAIVAALIIGLVSFLGWWAFVLKDDRPVPRWDARHPGGDHPHVARCRRLGSAR